MLSRLAPALLGRCQFPAPGTPVDCAVSGGADSLGLLVLAVAAGCDVTAYHVDHGLRPGSEKEAELVEAVANRLGAKFVSLKVDCAVGPNLEARARAARRLVLPKDVSTGHTADDQAETVLLNLLRGAGSAGMAGMRFGRSHPILSLRRFEVRELVVSLSLEPIEDPTNNDPAYLRNRVRHELLPLLNELARRDLVPVLCRQADLFREDSALLDELAGEIDEHDARALSSVALALARRAARRLCRLDGYPPSAKTVERVLSVARGEVVAAELPGGRRLSRSRGRLIVTDKKAPAPAPSPSER